MSLEGEFLPKEAAVKRGPAGKAAAERRPSSAVAQSVPRMAPPNRRQESASESGTPCSVFRDQRPNTSAPGPTAPRNCPSLRARSAAPRSILEVPPLDPHTPRPAVRHGHLNHPLSKELFSSDRSAPIDAAPGQTTMTALWPVSRPSHLADQRRWSPHAPPRISKNFLKNTTRGIDEQRVLAA